MCPLIVVVCYICLPVIVIYRYTSGVWLLLRDRYLPFDQ